MNDESMTREEIIEIARQAVKDAMASMFRDAMEAAIKQRDTLVEGDGMRWETTSEHIARDVSDGIFPKQSERRKVPMTPEEREKTNG